MFSIYFLYETKADSSRQIGDMLAQEYLPESLIDPCVSILKEIVPSERELIRIVVEIVLELRDTDESPEIDENLDIAASRLLLYTRIY